MASNSTLASLWDEVSGQGSPLRTLQGTPTKTTLASGTEFKEDALNFYKHAGLESMAKEVGILPADVSGELSNYKDQNIQPRVQMIAVPVASPMNNSPYKIEGFQQGAAARIISHAQVTHSPVVLSSTPQRIIQTQQVMTPKGAQLIATPITVESSQQDWGSASRKRVYMEAADYSEGVKRRKGEKGGKGLRHFSMKVCEKVQKKGVTSYNEVADELVSEFTDPRNMTLAEQTSHTAYDQKNIRRRVYDALNVLMAMNIISKEKKEIRWIGLPTNSAQECHNLEIEKRNLQERIRFKTQQLQELILQQIAFKNLVERNRHNEESQGPPTANSAIQLPFIIVNTSKKTVIDCSISNDKYEYLFNFDNTFEIHDDIEVLKRMGMAYGLENGKCNAHDLQKAIKLVPKSLEPYVLDLARVKPSATVSSGIVSIAPPKGNSTATSVSASAYNQASTSQDGFSGLSLAGSLEQSLDAEVAMVNSIGLSRQSSIGSYSDMASARESPEDEFSDDGESIRSSPNDLN